MSSTTAKALLIFALIVVNGVFSMSELAIVSARKARLQKRADDGDPGARAALDLAARPNRFLATVQVGITLVGIFAGAYGGAQLAEPLAAVIARIGPIAPVAHGLAIFLVVLVITYLSLVIGELVPKRIALNNPEGIAIAVARPMQMVSKVATPLVWILSRSTDLLLRLLRVRPMDRTTAAEEEIGLLLHEGTEAGVIDTEERRIVERVFRFGDRDIAGVMTPRTEIASLDLDDGPEALRAAVAAAGHVRLVVCRDGLDHVVGVVDVRDLLGQLLAGAELNIEAALRPVRFVPEHAPALSVLDLFRESGDKVAVVTDEYGTTAGLVALDDVLEALVGALPDARESPGVVRLADGSFTVSGAATIDEVEDATGVALPVAVGAYRTAAGWLVARLGRVPSVGDTVEAGALHVEVVRMAGPRVEALHVSVRPAGHRAVL